MRPQSFVSLARGSLFGVNPIDVAVAQMAARQRSLVHRDQALALGMTVRQFQARTQSGLYVRMQPNVVRLAGAPVTWEQRVLAACLSAGRGAAASHRSAALLWGFRGIEQAPVEVMVPVDRRPRLAEVVLHRSAAELTVHRAIPVTTPAATLVVLGSVVDAAAVESAVEDAILRRLTTPLRLVQSLERLGARGRNGSATLRRVLDERGDGAPTESVLEDMTMRLLRRAGMGEFERQYWVAGVRLDFAYPAIKLGIEVNGRAFHSRADDLQRNCRKLNRLVALGWRVLQFTWTDVRYRPDQVLDALGAVAA
jgi:very-short-patch-repair endonuclease